MFSQKKYFLFITIFIIIIGFNINVPCANNPTGEIKGKVSSSSGEVLYGAHIFLPSLGRGAVTNEKGEFIITNLPKGKHRVVISYIGYESEIRIVDLDIQNVVELNISLKQTVIPTEPVVITGNPFATNPLNSPQDISSLSGRDKIKSEASSLGKTLESLPGVYNLSTGSVVGKPIIRGQTSERVLILSDGIAQEYQQYGERHSPNIDAFNYDRIEIIKGAASLLYGSDAIGGAINLIPHSFHFSQSSKPEVNGAFKSGYYSNNNEYNVGLKLYSSIKNFALNASIIRRKADNFSTPDEPTYLETNKNDDPKFTGDIPYTNYEQLNGSVGLAYLSSLGIFSINYDHYFNKNNFLLPTSLPIGIQLENQIVNLKGNMPFNKFIIKPKLSYQRNHRYATQEGLTYKTLLDSANVDLILDVYTMRIEVENIDLLNLSGTIGTEIKYYDHENIGKVPLQPTGHFTNYSFFIFEEWQKNKLIFDFGTRLDYRNQLFYGTTTNPLLTTDDSRDYFNIFGSFGLAYKLFDNITITGNINRGFRSPSFFNLYVYGYHGGVFAFQIGNPNLKTETSLDLSSSLRFRNEKIKASFSVFHNIMNNYIFLYNAPNHPLAPKNAEFVFAHGQADALLTGIEFSFDARIFTWLSIYGNYSMVNSEFNSGVWKDSELPLMPPDKAVIGTKIYLPDYSVIKSPYISIDAKFVSSKKAAGIYEPFAQFDEGLGPDIPFGVCSTDDYNLVDFALGFDLQLYHQPINFDIEITNLFDIAYRDFLDTYKGYALSPGRSINVKINLPFN